MGLDRACSAIWVARGQVIHAEGAKRTAAAGGGVRLGKARGDTLWGAASRSYGTQTTTASTLLLLLETSIQGVTHWPSIRAGNELAELWAERRVRWLG